MESINGAMEIQKGTVHINTLAASMFSASKIREGITVRSTRAEQSNEKGKYVVGRCLSLGVAGGATVHERQLPRSAMQAGITKAASTTESSGTPIRRASSSSQLMDPGNGGKADKGAKTGSTFGRKEGIKTNKLP